MEIKAIHQDLQFSSDRLKNGNLIKIKDCLGKIDTVKDDYNNFDAIVKDCSNYMLVLNYVDRYGKLKELKITTLNITQDIFGISENYLVRVQSDLLNPELFRVGSCIKVNIQNTLVLSGLILSNEGSKIKIVYNKDGVLVTRYLTSQQFLNEEVYLVD